MKNTIKNFSREDDMRKFRLAITVFLGILTSVFAYYGTMVSLDSPHLPIVFYCAFYFPTAVTLSCMLVGILVEEDKPKESRYIQ